MAKNMAKRRRKIDRAAAEAMIKQGGLTQRAIAERLGCSQQSVARIRLKLLERGDVLPPNTSGAGRPMKTLPRRPVKMVDPPTLGEEALMGLDPHELGKVLFGVYGSEHLPYLRQRITELIHSDNYTSAVSQQIMAAINLDVKIGERLAAAIPDPPPNPAEDPANLDARKKVRDELTRLAEVRRLLLLEALCPTCRKHVA